MEPTHPPQLTGFDQTSSHRCFWGMSSLPSKTNSRESIGGSLHENPIPTDLTNLHHYKYSFSTNTRHSWPIWGFLNRYKAFFGQIWSIFDEIWWDLAKLSRILARSSEFRTYMFFANLIDIQLIPEETWLIQTKAYSRSAMSAILGDLKWSDWAQNPTCGQP